MKKERGFTLVEVMVTVAIMGVLAGIVGITMGVLLGQRVKSMAADTKSVFQSTQIASMSRDAAYIELRQSGDDAFVIAYSSAGNEINRAEGHDVQLYISINGAEEAVSSPVQIRFDRQTGGLKPIVDGGDDYLTAIRVTNGNKSVTLKVSRLTGKVTY
ncbi:MAG: type II secretion system protein [Lachnospiraceae bacterium]|nr:type II secretion system protein [Lachnospiraceae bacterium]